MDKEQDFQAYLSKDNTKPVSLIAQPLVKSFNSKMSKLVAFGFIASFAIMVGSLSMTASEEYSQAQETQFNIPFTHLKHSKVLGASITNGLVGYWGFDEASGLTTSDGSGNGNDGTLVGGVTRVTGKTGNGIQFVDGGSVNIPDKSFTNPDWTYAAWIKTSATDGWIMGSAEGSDLRLTGGKILFQFYTSTGFQNSYSLGSVNNNQWRHIAITRSGTTIKIYIDGVLDNTVTISGTGNISWQSIGARNDGSALGFTGTIDEIYAFQRALADSEITTLAGSSSPPPSSDTTPPTVSVTAPSGGATVSGSSTTVSATASDNVGVVGVQFKLDGSNLGTEDTSSPYSITWDTTQASNASHTITAVARDAVGNSTSSSGVTVTVNNVTPPSTVATPTISPNGGSFTSAQSVTISTSTSGASIRYTTDGSTPSSTTGTVYSTSFQVSSTSTIKAIAYKSGLVDSSVASSTFTITTTPPPTGACTGSNCINVDSATTYQTMVGWEGTDFTGYRYTTAWNNIKGQVFDSLANDLGINRVRLEVTSGIENNTDYFTQWINGQITESDWTTRSYEVVNDNSDPNTINPNGFQWSSLDDKIDNIILPLKQKLEARGEHLYININFVDFKRAGNTGYQHKSNPAEYAEFVLAVYQHMQVRNGIIPDSWEVILEPDASTAAWSAAQTAAAVKAAGDRLVAAGFTPHFVVPSVTSMSSALSYISAIENTPGAMQYVDTFSYHLYGGQNTSILQQIAAKAAQYGKKTAQLEYIGASYQNLQRDLIDGKNSSWAQYTLSTLAVWGANGGGGYYDIYDSNPNAPTLQIENQAKFLRQYFKYIRSGAIRINAANAGNPFIDPLAFKNTDNKYVVVTPVTGTTSFGVNGLPAGTYGIFYTATSNNTTVNLTDQTISSGGAVTLANIPAGVVTVYGKSAGSPPPPPPTDTTPPTVSITSPSAGATISGTTTISTTTTDNVGVFGVQFKIDNLNIGSEVTTSPFVANFDTTTVSNGSHSLTAVARDAVGNSTTSSSVSVTVNNIVPPPPTTNTPPTGSLDGVRTTDNIIFGWAQDPDNLNTPVLVHLYFDGPAGSGRTPLVATAADNRSDVGNHAFNVSIPTTYFDGASHSVYVYAIDLTDTTGASNRLLSGSPKSFTTSVTPPPPPPPAPTGSDLYVSTTGSASGNGSLAAPWDLQTAMYQPSSVTNGKTIYMRGGTYHGKFISNLVGTTLRSYPGEWAKVDGYLTTTTSSAIGASTAYTTYSPVTFNGSYKFIPGQSVIVDSESMQINGVNPDGTYAVVRGWNGTSAVAHNSNAPVQLTGNVIEVNGSNSTYRDFEVYDSNPNRVFYNTTGYGGALRGEGEGFMIFGNDLKFINLVVHDNGDGLFLSEPAQNTEVYGVLTYNNGHVSSDRPHGHGLYIQNDTGSKNFDEIISFNNFALGMKSYGANQGHSNNVHFKGIISFNNGTPGYFVGNPTQFPSGGRAYGNLEIGSDVYPSSNVSVDSSFLYHKPGTVTEVGGMPFGRSVTGSNTGATVTNNYLVDTYNGFAFNQWSNVTMTGNTEYLSGAPDPAYDAKLVTASGSTNTFTINNNNYYDNTRVDSTCVGSNRYSFVATGVTMVCSNGTPVSVLTFDKWKTGAGFDTNSTYTAGRPTGKQIFVRPNIYEPGRANIVAYNWDLSPTISVNLSNAGLTPGQKFEVRSAENYMGTPVLTNQTYTAGMSVTLSAASRTVATPIGLNYTPGSTCPEFCAYVIVPLTAGTQQSVDTTPPVISITAPTAGATINGTYVITTNSSDNVGVVGVQFKVDGLNIGSEVTTAPFIANFNTTTVASGAHSLTAIARDAAGNTTTSSAVAITINNQAQTTVVTPVISPNGGSFTTTQTVTLTSTTSGASIRYTTNGTDPTSSSTLYTSAITISTTTTLKAKAFATGSTDSAIATATFTINIPNAPSATFSTSPTSISAGQNSTLTWATTNAAAVSINNGIGSVATSGTRTVSPSATTTYVLTVTGLDSTVITKTITVTVTTPPLPTNQKPTGSLDGFNSATNVIFGWAQDPDNLSVPITIHIYIDKNAGTAGAAPIVAIASDNRNDVGNHAFNFPVPSQYKDGQAHQVWVWAIDLTDPAGNNVQLAGSPKTFTITGPDITPPTISNIVVDQGLYNVKKIGVSWTTDEPSDSQIEYGLTSSYGQSSPLISVLDTSHLLAIGNLNPSTTYHFRVKSKDSSGNLAVSDDQTFTTRGRWPKPPKPAAILFRAGSIILNWNNFEYDLCSAIEIYRSDTAAITSPDNNKLIVSLACDATTYRDTAVTAGVTYYYSLFVKDDLGTYSDPLSGSFTAPTNTSTGGSGDSGSGGSLPPTSGGDGSNNGGTGGTQGGNNSGAVVLPANVIAGQVIKFSNNPTVYLVQSTGLHPFDTYDSLSSYLNVSHARVIERSGSVAVYTVSTIFARDILMQTPPPANTDQPVEGDNFVCGGSKTIYFYHNNKKEAYSEPAVYEAWNGKNYSALKSIDQNTCSTIADNGLARLPQNTIIKVNGSKEIYLLEGEKARPFTSFDSYQRISAGKNVSIVSLPYLHTYARGENLN